MSTTNQAAVQSHSSSSATKSTTAQLNVRIDQLLAHRLRQRAKELHCSPGALVAQAIEQLLDNGMPDQVQEEGEGILRRLQELEARVAELEQQGQERSSQ
jgi:predicted transcriptional regulator